MIGGVLFLVAIILIVMVAGLVIDIQEHKPLWRDLFRILTDGLLLAMMFWLLKTNFDSRVEILEGKLRQVIGNNFTKIEGNFSDIETLEARKGSVPATYKVTFKNKGFIYLSPRTQGFDDLIHEIENRSGKEFSVSYKP
jgi:hypothetical protein